MTFSEIREFLNNGFYNPAYVEVPQRVSDGYIFDEDQSVRWNREKAVAQNEARKIALKENQIAFGKASQRFEEDLVAAVCDEYKFTESQATLIYNRAYESGHSGGYLEVLSKAEDLADFVEKFL